MTGARSGLLPGGLPYRAVGTGPPVVVLPRLTGDNADPSGAGRRTHLRPFTPLTARFPLEALNDRAGYQRGRGYVHQCEAAASEVVQEALEPYSDDMSRLVLPAVPVVGTQARDALRSVRP